MITSLGDIKVSQCGNAYTRTVSYRYRTVSYCIILYHILLHSSFTVALVLLYAYFDYQQYDTSIIHDTYILYVRTLSCRTLIPWYSYTHHAYIHVSRIHTHITHADADHACIHITLACAHCACMNDCSPCRVDAHCILCA